jgi:hypothetical protein
VFFNGGFMKLFALKWSDQVRESQFYCFKALKSAAGREAFLL